MIRTSVNRFPACIAATLVVLALGACSAPTPADTEAAAMPVAAPAPADAPADIPQSGAGYDPCLHPTTPPSYCGTPSVDPCKHPSPPSYCSSN